MATPTMSDSVVQIVGEKKDDKSRIFNTEGFKGLMDAYYKDHDALYPIYSVIGAQGSGKSTLMNKMFNTNFGTLVQETEEGRKATTKGIWAAICNSPKAIVLDVEGSDGEEHEDDPRFQNQSALFALAISDVIIVNIDLKDIGRNHGASTPIFKIVFQECLKHNIIMHKKSLVFTVRDYNGKTEPRILLMQLSSTLEQIWNQLDNGGVRTFKNYFGEPSIEVFPNFENQPDEFENKCKAIVDKWSAKLAYQGSNTRLVDDFPNRTAKLWDMIQQNQRIAIPSFQDMVSLSHCEQIKSNILECLKNSNEDYQLLSNGNPENPSGFHQKLVQVLRDARSRFENETKYDEESIVKSVQEKLKAEIIHEVEKKFEDIVKRFMVKLYMEAAQKITKDCQETILDKRGRANSVVKYCVDMFSKETEGIDLYGDFIEEQKIILGRDIKFIGDELLKVAKKQTMWDAAEVMSIVLGGLVLTGAAGYLVGTAIPEVSQATVVGIRNTLQESDGKLNRHKNKVLSNRFGYDADSKGTQSGGSSSSSK